MKQLTSEDFDQAIEKGVAVIDFYADWCGPCKTMEPNVAAVAEKYEGKAVVAKVNVDTDNELAMRYMISSIPTTLVFKDGEVQETLVGVQSEEALSDQIECFLAADSDD